MILCWYHMMGENVNVVCKDRLLLGKGLMFEFRTSCTFFSLCYDDARSKWHTVNRVQVLEKCLWLVFWEYSLWKFKDDIQVNWVVCRQVVERECVSSLVSKVGRGISLLAKGPRFESRTANFSSYVTYTLWWCID